MAQFREKTALY